MTSPNAALIVRTLQAADDPEALIAFLSEDAEWHVAKEHPESRICRGRDEIRAYLREWQTQLPGMRFVADDLSESGERVLATGRVRGTGAAGTVDVEVPLAIIYTIRNGEIVEGREYLDLDRAAREFTRSDDA